MLKFERLQNAYLNSPKVFPFVGFLICATGLVGLALVMASAAGLTGSGVLPNLVALVFIALFARTFFGLVLLANGRLWELFSFLGVFRWAAGQAIAGGESALGIPHERRTQVEAAG